METIEKLKKELEWCHRYMYYVAQVHSAVDGSACGFADRDDEYYEFITCQNCSYDVVSDDGFLMGHYCSDNEWRD